MFFEMYYQEFMTVCIHINMILFTNILDHNTFYCEEAETNAGNFFINLALWI